MCSDQWEASIMCSDQWEASVMLLEAVIHCLQADAPCRGQVRLEVHVPRAAAARYLAAASSKRD